MRPMHRGIGAQYGVYGSVTASHRLRAVTAPSRRAMCDVLGVLKAYADSRHHPLTPSSVLAVERELAPSGLDMRFFSNATVNEPVFD